VIYPLGLIALLSGTSGNTAVLAHFGGFAVGLFGINFFDRQNFALQFYPPDNIETNKATESLGMKVLRIISVVMMVVGVILGIFTYYLDTLL